MGSRPDVLEHEETRVRQNFPGQTGLSRQIPKLPPFLKGWHLSQVPKRLNDCPVRERLVAPIVSGTVSLLPLFGVLVLDAVFLVHLQNVSQIPRTSR